MKSQAMDLYSLGGMFTAGKNFRPDATGWGFPDKPLSRLLQANSLSLKEDARNLGPDFLKTKAAGRAGPVNEFLVETGVPEIQLEDLGDGVYMAGVADTGVHFWRNRGIDRVVNVGGNSYPGFELLCDGHRGRNHLVQFLMPTVGRHPVISVPTCDSWRAVFVIPEQVPNGPEDLWNMAHNMLAARNQYNAAHAAYEGVCVPCVSYEGQCDVNEFIGMPLMGTALTIKQAKQVIRVGINAKGFRARAAASAAAIESLSKKHNCLVLDQPFMCCFTAGNQATNPLFPAYYTPESWKEGKLEF